MRVRVRGRWSRVVIRARRLLLRPGLERRLALVGRRLAAVRRRTALLTVLMSWAASIARSTRAAALLPVSRTLALTRTLSLTGTLSLGGARTLLRMALALLVLLGTALPGGVGIGGWALLAVAVALATAVAVAAVAISVTAAARGVAVSISARPVSLPARSLTRGSIPKPARSRAP